MLIIATTQSIFQGNPILRNKQSSVFKPNTSNDSRQRCVKK